MHQLQLIGDLGDKCMYINDNSKDKHFLQVC